MSQTPRRCWRQPGAPEEDLAAGLVGDTPEEKVKILRSLLVHNRRKYTPDVQALNALIEHPGVLQYCATRNESE